MMVALVLTVAQFIVGVGLALVMLVIIAQR